MSSLDDNTPRRGGGPKTARGKSIARWNALKHGATAKKLFCSNGPHRPEYERYQQLCQELQEELASGAYLEDKVLVQKFICDTLMLERCAELQLRLLPTGDEAVACEGAPNSFRYIAHAERSFFKSLQFIRDLRQRVEETEAAEIEATAGVDDQTSAPEHKRNNGECDDDADQQSESPASAPHDTEA
jgi:hypothetical protein